MEISSPLAMSHEHISHEIDELYNDLYQMEFFLDSSIGLEDIGGGNPDSITKKILDFIAKILAKIINISKIMVKSFKKEISDNNELIKTWKDFKTDYSTTEPMKLTPLFAAYTSQGCRWFNTNCKKSIANSGKLEESTKKILSAIEKFPEVSTVEDLGKYKKYGADIQVAINQHIELYNTLKSEADFIKVVNGNKLEAVKLKEALDYLTKMKFIYKKDETVAFTVAMGDSICELLERMNDLFNYIIKSIESTDFQQAAKVGNIINNEIKKIHGKFTNEEDKKKAISVEKMLSHILKNFINITTTAINAQQKISVPILTNTKRMLKSVLKNPKKSESNKGKSDEKSNENENKQQ